MYQIREIKTLKYASHVAQYDDRRLIEVWMLRGDKYITLTRDQFRKMVQNTIEKEGGDVKISDLALIAVLDAPVLFVKQHHQQPDDRRRNDWRGYRGRGSN